MSAPEPTPPEPTSSVPTPSVPGAAAAGSPDGPRPRSGLRLPAAVLIGLLAFAVLTPHLGPSPDTQALERSLQAPSAHSWFGTDVQGRDLFARSARGLGLSLRIGLLASLLATTLGVVVGSIAGFVGGRVDSLLMRLVDVLYGLPYVAFVVVLLLVFGRTSTNLFLAIGVTSWLTTARIVRAEVRAVRVRDYISAATALGATRLRILVRHVLPNVAGTIMVYAAITVPMAIRQEALLSFLGLGVAPPEASLGSLLREGLAVLSPLRDEWWLLLVPTLILVALVAGLNGLADFFGRGSERGEG